MLLNVKAVIFISHHQMNLRIKSIICFICCFFKYMDLKFGCLENKNGEHRINSSLEKLRQLSQKN
jgi:hypothetical protein